MGDNEYIVEIKNRQNKLFGDIPKYEEVQIITYMKLTKIYKCKHIEQYNNEINENVMNYDHKKWKNIEVELIEFTNYYEKVYFSTFLQDLLLQKIISDQKIMDRIPSSNFNFTICRNTKINKYNIIMYYSYILNCILSINSDVVLLLVLNILMKFINS